MLIASSGNRAVFDCRALFLFLFWRSKKENINKKSPSEAGNLF